MSTALLIGAAALGLGLHEYFSKKPKFQVVNAPPHNGVPVKVAVPLPASVNANQSTGTAPPRPSRFATAVLSMVGNRGAIYAPPNAVQPNASGAAQPTPIVITPTGSSSIAIGSVKDVQRALNTLGFVPKLAEDGILGPMTIRAIKAYQGQCGLVVDGNAGPPTKAALSASLSALASGGRGGAAMGAEHPIVDAALAMRLHDVKRALNMLGASPPLPIDGVASPAYVAALKGFQACHGLAIDGIAGPMTKSVLYSAVNA